MNDLESAYREFWDDLTLRAQASGDPARSVFFQMFSEMASSNGDCLDLEYTPALKEGSGGYQLDGIALDPERGELDLAICDFRQEPELQPLNQAHIDPLFRRVERFFASALEPEFVNKLESASPAFEAAYPVFEHSDDISRVRVIVFSNARLATRKKSVDAKSVQGREFTYNVLHFGRYHDIASSRTGSEPIEIDIQELNGAPLPCLKAHTGESSYTSYLAVVPGVLLADIYGRYGARLLEQNVRTYLQARTKVNKGILNTIGQNPGMFFAYNNGLTATASDISTVQMKDGVLGIQAITNLQIVNGGQTTASILYAKDKSRAELSSVFVQMKLSQIEPDELESVVPKISEYANTQNRISAADFFSTHPFHLEMEKISRRLPAPQKAGAFASSKWFYERARGQYRDQKAYGTAASRKRFETEFPKDQVIDKTDIAKYLMTFEREPHTVSLGAQKCFLAFAKQISEAWESHPNDFNDAYFKELVAKTIVFRWTDKMISNADWYQQDRGHKANIVTYTIAWLVDYLNVRKQQLDLDRIWNNQEPGDRLRTALSYCAPTIAQAIKSPPPETKNISEYCKRQYCWKHISELIIQLPVDLKPDLIDRSEARSRKKESVTLKQMDNELEFESRLFLLQSHAEGILEAASKSKLLTDKSSSAFKKIRRGSLNLSAAEKKAAKTLLEQLKSEGYELPV